MPLEVMLVTGRGMWLMLPLRLVGLPEPRTMRIRGSVQEHLQPKNGFANQSTANQSLSGNLMA